jgi:hypothetical protein
LKTADTAFQEQGFCYIKAGCLEEDNMSKKLKNQSAKSARRTQKTTEAPINFLADWAIVELRKTRELLELMAHGQLKIIN